MGKRSQPLSNEEIALIKAVEAFIQKEFPRIRSRADMVKRFNAYQKGSFLSEIFLREHYTHVCRVPPMKYVRKLRIEKAINMLTSRDVTYSMKEISKACGLTLTGFMTFFKKWEGMPPGKFRKANWITFSPE